MKPSQLIAGLNLSAGHFPNQSVAVNGKSTMIADLYETDADLVPKEPRCADLQS